MRINIYCGDTDIVESNINEKEYDAVFEMGGNQKPLAQIREFDEIVEYARRRKYKNIVVLTNSPYVLNYLNLMIARYDNNIEGTKISYEDVEVYCVRECGEGLNHDIVIDLKSEKKERKIDTTYFSEVIEWISSELRSIEEQG